jgi:hypothetical protein
MRPQLPALCQHGQHGLQLRQALDIHSCSENMVWLLRLLHFAMTPEQPSLQGMMWKYLHSYIEDAAKAWKWPPFRAHPAAAF